MSMFHHQPVSIPVPPAGAVTMFTTTWCGYCRRLKGHMEREGVTFTEVNIETTPGAADYVMGVNGGHQTVPTVLFADGSSASNPPIREVVDRAGSAQPGPG